MRRITSNLQNSWQCVLLYAAFGCSHLPAGVIRERGLHAEEIGIVLAASRRSEFWPVQRSVMPLIASKCMCYAVRLRTRRCRGQPGIRDDCGFDGLLIVGLVQQQCWLLSLPISDALSTTAARRSEAVRTSGSSMDGYEHLARLPFAGTVLSGWGADRTNLTSISGLAARSRGRWHSVSCCPASVKSNRTEQDTDLRAPRLGSPATLASSAASS